MNPILRDLFAHQSWADAEHWRAYERFPASLEDPKLVDRLHHLHFTQHAFLWAVGDRREAFVYSKMEDFSLAALKDYARRFHADIAAFLERADGRELSRRISIPWFKNPPLEITVQEALTQCAMHSQHHRAQNATRLRELRGEPPSTDLIVWYWKGRPPAKWEV